jgi:hypothetical protein
MCLGSREKKESGKDKPIQVKSAAAVGNCLPAKRLKDTVIKNSYRGGGGRREYGFYNNSFAGYIRR